MSGIHRAVVAVAAGLAGLVVVGGCSSENDDRLVVLAASSLTDVFDRLEGEYEAMYPDVDVVMSYGGSSTLVAQLDAGASADVLATADLITMERASIGGEPIVFALNSLVIAVEPGNPLGIKGLSDLPNVPVVVLADESVPAGAYSRDALRCEGVDLVANSLEQNVRAAAAKVALGEADASLVYRTDIGSDLAAVEISPACNVVAEYPIAVVSDRPSASAFVAFVRGAAGAEALTDAGFELP